MKSDALKPEDCFAFHETETRADAMTLHLSFSAYLPD